MKTHADFADPHSNQDMLRIHVSLNRKYLSWFCFEDLGDEKRTISSANNLQENEKVNTGMIYTPSF